MKRIFLILIFSILFLFIEVINWVSFILDELLFPSYKTIQIITPVFITGMPRTATTYMYNILNKDKDRFSSMKLWEIILAPSITQRKILLGLKHLDKKLNHFIFRVITKSEKTLFKKFQSFHPLSLFCHEEDEYIFFHNFSSFLLIFFFPFIKSFHAQAEFDTFLSDKRRKRILKYYQKCIKKHLYIHGKNKTYLAKSPSHIFRINSLRKNFPDCKIIYMLRLPHQSIPSTISLFHNFSDIFHSRISSNRITERTLALADRWLRASIDMKSLFDKNTFSLIKFETFTNNPYLVITRLYDQFGFLLSDELKSVILKTLNSEKSNKVNKHVYSLKKFGLTRSDILTRYDFIYKNFYSYENQ